MKEHLSLIVQFAKSHAHRHSFLTNLLVALVASTSTAGAGPPIGLDSLAIRLTRHDGTCILTLLLAEAHEQLIADFIVRDVLLAVALALEVFNGSSTVLLRAKV